MHFTTHQPQRARLWSDGRRLRYGAARDRARTPSKHRKRHPRRGQRATDILYRTLEGPDGVNVDGNPDLKAMQLSEAPADSSSQTDGTRRSRTTQLSLASVGILSLLAPTAAYFWFVQQYSVNVPYADQWYSDVPLLGDFYSGRLTLGNLWALHYDHRMLFPNLIVLALAQSTHFNIIFEEYLGAVFLAVSVGLFVLAHKSRSPSTPWIYYFPVSLLLFSFVQFQNSLWGFQMAWYLVMLAFAIAVFLLDRPTLSWLVLTGAIGAAVLGSFSSLQGLFIWPIGLMLLLYRRRSKGLVVAWVASAVITGGVYFHHFQYYGPSDRFSVFVHPIAALEFFFFSLGAVVGNQATNPATDPSVPTIVLGLIIFLVAIWIVLAHVIPRQGAASGSPIGVALILFGLLFAIFVTEGRAFHSPYEPRYTTYNLLILVGCYLTLLNRLPLRSSSPRRSLPALGVDSAGHSAEQRSITQDKSNDRPSVVWAVVGTVLLSVICLQVILGTSNGLASAQSWSESQRVAADIAVNANVASNTLVYGGEQAPSVLVRQSIMVLRSQDLSLFATSEKTQYKKTGLFPDLTDVHTNILVPKDGAELDKTQLLEASASDPSGVIKVDFRLVDRATMRSTLIGTGIMTLYGPIAYWNTTRVANGTYGLQSVAFGPDNRTSYSPIITISVLQLTFPQAPPRRKVASGLEDVVGAAARAHSLGIQGTELRRSQAPPEVAGPNGRGWSGSPTCVPSRGSRRCRQSSRSCRASARNGRAVA